MPINTKIEGSPDSVRQAAAWLKSSLSAGVHDATTQVHQARTNSEAGWSGAASEAFRGRMTTVAQGGDDLAGDAATTGTKFDSYADSMQTAQAGMQRAKQIALQGGLTVNGDVIEDPGAAPTVPQSLPADGSATPQQVQGFNEGQQAVADHQRKVQAFGQAQQEADRANGVMAAAKEVLGGSVKDLTDKKYVHAAEFVNENAGRLVEKHVSTLKGEAGRLRDEAKVAESRYLKAPGGSDEARFQTETQMAKNAAADGLEKDAASVARRVGSKIPVVGLGITALGIGYDIHEGKPPGKAIISGLAGAGAAALVAGPVGVGAIAAVGAGILVGAGVDYAWDHWVPDGAKHAIDNGVKAVGNAIGDAAGAVGHAAAKVWDSIF